MNSSELRSSCSLSMSLVLEFLVDFLFSRDPRILLGLGLGLVVVVSSSSLESMLKVLFMTLLVLVTVCENNEKVFGQCL